MKKLFTLLVAAGLALLGSSCTILPKSCTERPKTPSGENTYIISEKVDVNAVNGKLSGLGVYDVLAGNEIYAYRYNYKAKDYEYFTLNCYGGVNLKVQIIPRGKMTDDVIWDVGPSPQTANVNGMEVVYNYERKRHEDCFEFDAYAAVTCGGDSAYINYKYISAKKDCEILDLVSALFYGKEV